MGEEQEEVKSLPLKGERLAQITSLEETICKWWPMHWPAIEACLAASATLFLRDVSQALALVLLARSGAGKGTILEQFQGAANTEWRDKFSRASLLSGYGEAKKKDLQERALFKVAKHKTLIIGDLNPLLKAGDREGLSQFYADFAVWLDGGGLAYDTGTHGLMGEKGDFTFVLLGGATPFRSQVWRAMAELGPRLLFYPVPGRSSGEGPSPEEYAFAKRECREAVQTFLNWLANNYSRRSQSWPTRNKKIGLEIDKMCRLIAAAQTLGSGFSILDEVVRPTASHLMQRIATISASRAWLYERKKLDLTDIAFVERLALASCPTARGAILLSMSEGCFEVREIAERTGYFPSFIIQHLQSMEKVGVVTACGRLPTGSRGAPTEIWKILEDPTA